MDFKKAHTKMKRQMTLGMNKFRGKLAEDTFVMQEQMKGNKPKRTGRGSDYDVNGQLYEVKSSGTATVSKLQKKGVKKGKVKVVRPHWIG